MSITIKEIARLTGTSPAAVSFVFNGKDHKRVSPDKRAAIMEVAQKYGYRRNTAARSLVLQRNFKISLCTYGLFHQYPIVGNFSMYESITGCAKCLHEHSYGVDIIQVDREKKVDEVVESLVKEDTDAFVFINWDVEVLKKVMDKMRRGNTPCVSLGVQLPGKHSWASIDREGAMYEGAKYLIAEGCRRILYIRTDRGYYSPVRMRGYEKCMDEAGKEKIVVSVENFTAKSVCVALRDKLAQDPEIDAVLFDDNFYATTVLQTLEDKDMRIVGFGDAAFSTICEPKLTYLRLPIDNISQFCVESALKMIESPSEKSDFQKIFSAELVVQDT